MLDNTHFKSAKVWMTLLATALLAACAHGPQQPLTATLSSPVANYGSDFQSVTGFDIYRDQQRLHAVLTSSQPHTKQTTIAYLYSDDQGQSWSKPQSIGQGFNLAVESKQGNDIQIAASDNNILVIWQVSGEIPGMGPLLVIHSQDGGHSWQQGANPTGSDIDQSHHDLAADAQGRFHLVWLDDRDENGYQGVRYARSADTGQHWELAQTIDDSSCSCCWNRIMVSPQGHINVLYRDMAFRDMALAQSSDGGEHWQRLSTVGAFNWKFDGCPHNGGGISQAAGGDLHAVVWTGAENRAGMYHLQSADQGQTWSEPQAVAPGTGAFHGDIAAFDRQRLARVWDAMGPEGSSVLIADSADNGVSWSEARLISTPGRPASHPRIISTDQGWLVLWTEKQTDGRQHWRSAVVK